MANQQKDNSGALFKNKRKKQDTHPDYNGSIMVEGKEYWINAWLNTAQSSGEKYMGLSVQPKEEQQASNEPAPSTDNAQASSQDPATESNDFDDDIPF